MLSTTLTKAARATSRTITGAASSRGFSVLTATEEFPDLPATSTATKKASSSSVTALPSGLTIVTEDASLVSTVSLTFPNAGSSNEHPSEAGAAIANRYLSFKSGSGLSSAMIIRNLEDVGASLFSFSGRRGASLGYTAAKENAAFVASLLATTTESSFEKWDVQEAQDLAAAESVEAAADPQAALSDQIYAAAFGAQSTMGRSYYTSGASRASIMSFRDRAYTLNGAVLAATGVDDHQAFVRMVEDEFPMPGPGNLPEAVILEYMGGEARAPTSAGDTHVALAFEGPSSAPLMNVLKHCLGASAFASKGIIGVCGGSTPSDASGTLDVLSKTIVTAPSADAVAAAKASAKGEALKALDSGSQSLAGAMTASILDSRGFSAGALAELYDAVTADDVCKAHAAMLKSKLSLAAVGDITGVPYHATIEARFA